MPTRGIVESSPEDDKTILPMNALLPQASQSSVLEKSDPASSSKASLVAQQKLGDFFPSLTQDSTASKTKYTDSILQQIADLLRLSERERWSTVPRIYTVLRSIGQLQLIDEFIDEGFTDIWFPFTAHNLPPRLSPSIKAQFLTTQSVVFTQALDLEKKEGRHATFAADEPLWFESRGKLGRGAFGVVDKVVSLITLHEYARKRMRRGNNFTKSKREIKEFKAELAILKTVNHHHCVKLVGSYTDPVYLGLIMDPVADCDLGRFLAEALTNNDKKSLLRGYFGCLASALQYLHERQIRHRDIKPPNILVKGDAVYLADFGIALDWSEMTRGTTTADTAKSPIYCAPEVARSEPRGQSADIWSLGCVFVEMVSVLKGSSVEDMRSCFKKTSGSYMFHHNIQTCDQWLSDLKNNSAFDNPPIEWCRKMLLLERNERCTADQLLEAIRLESEPDHLRYFNQSFCGDCCMEQEYISSDDNDVGEDPWADSEDEATLRAQNASVREAALQHMPDAIKRSAGESVFVLEVSSQAYSAYKQSRAEEARTSSEPYVVPSNSNFTIDYDGNETKEQKVEDIQEIMRNERPSPSLISSSRQRSYPSRTLYNGYIPPNRSGSPVASPPLASNATITIVSASYTVKNKGFSSTIDSYAVLMIGHTRVGSTYAVGNTTNPIWAQDFDVQVTEDSLVRVQIIDRNKSLRADGRLGYMSTRIGDAFDVRLDKAQWYVGKLPQFPKSELGEAQRGNVTLKFRPMVLETGSLTDSAPAPTDPKFDSAAKSSREPSRGSNREAEDRERRRGREERRARDDGALHVGTDSSTEERTARRHEETSRTAARQIEHQSSLRSLISASDIDSREMEEEILRQIREEGLLDGIDFENLDASQEDQISERIAEAFRRRQAEKARQEATQRSNHSEEPHRKSDNSSQEPARRSEHSGRRRKGRSSAPDSRETSGDDTARTSSRTRKTRNLSTKVLDKYHDLAGRKLPKGWVMHQDNLGRTYYVNYNNDTKSQWRSPLASNT